MSDSLVGVGTPYVGVGTPVNTATRPRLLDLFCCQGGAAKGYADAGFEVVGVDVQHQPRYPYSFVQADAMLVLAKLVTNTSGYILADIDAVHASPPCQDHSQSRHATKSDPHGTGWMLDATRHFLRMWGGPWVIENVGAAKMTDALTLCGTSFGLGLHRHRRFETSFAMLAPPCNPGLVRYTGREAEIFGHHGNSDRIRAEWGVEWMDRDGIAQSIPPAMTAYVGEQLLAHISERAA